MLPSLIKLTDLGNLPLFFKQEAPAIFASGRGELASIHFDFEGSVFELCPQFTKRELALTRQTIF